MNEGRIPHCPHQNCAFRCCEFQQGNYIVMYPEETEQAKKEGKSLGHLELTPYHGGFKAICKAKDTARCDGGYKPLDCQCYPFFPTVEDEKIQVGLKGKKCPLTRVHLQEHRSWVKKQWEKMSSVQVLQWLRKVTLVGYGRYE